MGVPRPSNNERLALERIGSHPVGRPRKPDPWKDSRAEVVRDRTGQAFIYHTCVFIASWEALQDSLNDKQSEFEAIYGPWVECINVYRQNSVKDGSHRIVAIFKIFVGRP